MLFHLTLKYEFELYDELSMMHLICWCYVCLLQRHDCNQPIEWKFGSLLSIIWTAWLTVVGTVSHFLGYEAVHEWYRMIGSCTFCALAVLAFSNLSRVANECKGIGKAMKTRHQYINFVETYFNRSGYLFIVAVISWILENAFCPYTNYLQLHAFVWHLFTCIGLFYGSQILIAHRLYSNRN